MRDEARVTADSRPISLGHLVTAGALGVLAPLGTGGAAIAISGLLSTILMISPVLGVFAALATKPAIDCLWAMSVLQFEGFALNLQSVVGILIPLTLAAALIRRRLGRFTRVEQAGLGYVCATLIAVALSPSKGTALNDMAKIALPFVFVLAGRLLAEDGVRASSMALLLASYGAVPAMTGGLELLGLLPHPEGIELSPSGVHRIAGFYHHPLDIAMRCSIAIPFGLATFRFLRSNALRIAMLMYVGLLVAISYATLVRSALVIVVAQLALWMWVTKHRVLAGGVLLGAFAIFIVAPPVQRVVREAVRPLKEGSVYELGTGRALLYAAQVTAYVAASPVQKVLGRGLHSVQGVIVKYSPIPVVALEDQYEAGGGVGSHNQFLRVLTEAGLLGLVTLSILIFLVFRSCLRGMSPELNTDTIVFSSAALCSLAAITGYCMALTPLDSPGITWPLWLLVGYQTGALGSVIRSR
jgi:hypothetical protein